VINEEAGSLPPIIFRRPGDEFVSVLEIHQIDKVVGLGVKVNHEGEGFEVEFGQKKLARDDKVSRCFDFVDQLPVHVHYQHLLHGPCPEDRSIVVKGANVVDVVTTDVERLVERVLKTSLVAIFFVVALKQQSILEAVLKDLVELTLPFALELMLKVQFP